MKKIICVCLVIAMVFALSLSMASCGAKEPSPTEVLDSFLKDIQQNGLSEEDLGLGEITGEGEDAEYLQAIVDKMKDFEYELSNESIDGDSATVDLKVKTYGFGSMITESLSEYLQQAFIMAFSDASEDEMTALFESLIAEKINTLGKNYEKTVTVEMVKGEDGWDLKDKTDSNPMYDALMGGLYSSISNLDSMFGEGE